MDTESYQPKAVAMGVALCVVKKRTDEFFLKLSVNLMKGIIKDLKRAASQSARSKSRSRPTTDALLGPGSILFMTLRKFVNKHYNLCIKNLRKLKVDESTSDFLAKIKAEALARKYMCVWLQQYRNNIGKKRTALAVIFEIASKKLKLAFASIKEAATILDRKSFTCLKKFAILPLEMKKPEVANFNFQTKYEYKEKVNKARLQYSSQKQTAKPKQQARSFKKITHKIEPRKKSILPIELGSLKIGQLLLKYKNLAFNSICKYRKNLPDKRGIKLEKSLTLLLNRRLFGNMKHWALIGESLTSLAISRRKVLKQSAFTSIRHFGAEKSKTINNLYHRYKFEEFLMSDLLIKLYLRRVSAKFATWYCVYRLQRRTCLARTRKIKPENPYYITRFRNKLSMQIFS